MWIIFVICCILVSFKPWYGTPWGGINDAETCRSDIELLFVYIKVAFVGVGNEIYNNLHCLENLCLIL